MEQHVNVRVERAETLDGKGMHGAGWFGSGRAVSTFMLLRGAVGRRYVWRCTSSTTAQSNAHMRISSLVPLTVQLAVIFMVVFNGAISAQSNGSAMMDLPVPPSNRSVAPATLANAPDAAPAMGGASAYTYQVIPADGGTYGYEVRSGGQTIIRQMNVPGRPGNGGCPTPEKAAQLAQLVITKLQAGNGPPTITPTELTQIGL